ncbi:MAG: prepilin peptidase [Candidatus Methanoperedens sp.]|nr:prepilin peptidase [Candidatus Methanoperedens sp.]MCE8429422.1 prepilin peptidase [Candidatus Methanoperedens sp.]
MLDILKILFCIPFLFYSCYSDIRTRRVSNDLWLIMLFGSSFFVLYDISVYRTSYLLHLIFSAGFTFGFVYILFQLGTFGGADAKSLIVLSIILPAYPDINVLGSIFPLNRPLIDLFAFGVLGNAVLLTITVPITLALYNLIKMHGSLEEPLFIFIGYKTKISKLDSKKHIKLIQDIENNEKGIRFIFKRGGRELDEGIIQELKGLAKKGLIGDYIWVTPGLPFMIPITLGFFVAVFYGDMITELTKFLLYSN